MRNKVTLIIGILMFVGIGDAVLADAPIYAPYGAWRGRIHYAEGRHGVRTRVRWGGGLTPVAGQVLSNFIGTAGNVLTNENFLNAASNVIRDTRELDPNIARLNNEIEQNNIALTDQLNEVRGLVGLPKMPYPETATTPATPSTSPQQGGRFPTMAPEEVQRTYGENPWSGQ